MYKITFQLNSPICFIDRPIFDAIIAYCYAKEFLGGKYFPLRNSNEQQIDFEAMPIKRHPEADYFRASWMFWDEDKAIEFTGSWKKRWDSNNDDIANFGKNKRKIEVNKGAFKSYSMPLNLYAMKRCWFFFESDNVKEVEKLLRKWLFGIGKKTSQGYGEIEKFKIEKSKFNFDEEICRPIPIVRQDEVLAGMLRNKEMKFAYTGYKPPYWLPENQKVCRIK